MFDPIIKQKQPFAARILESALTPGREKPANAYILTGNNTDDMLFLANETARILNCGHKIEECTCVNCSWVRQNTHPAVIRVEPEKTVITIARTRELKHSLLISSQYHRVIIFTKADYKTLHSESANALLKIIEEPPRRVTFFFFARDREDMLDTIVSRSQVIPLKYTPEPVFDFSLLGGFPPENREKALLLAEKLLKENTPAEDILEIMQRHLVLNIKQNSENRDFCLKNINYLKNVQKAANELKSYVNPQAVLDSLLLSGL